MTLTELTFSEAVGRILQLFTSRAYLELTGQALICAIPFLAMRWTGHAMIWKPLARRLRPSMTHEIQEKFSKACWHTLCYGTFWVAAIYFSLGQPWGLEFDKGLWQGYPFSSSEPLSSEPPYISPAANYLRPLFVAEMGFYFHCMVVSMIEPRRSDFAVIVAHHVLALLLLGGSFCSKMVHVGTSVLVTLDIADVFFYLAKIIHYTTDKVAYHAVALGIMAVAFFCSRVLLMGLIVYSVWFRVHDVELISPEVYRDYYHPFHTVLQGMLTLIWAMQLFWFLAIIVVAKDLVIKRKVLDPIFDHGRDLALEKEKPEKEKEKEKRRSQVRASS